MDSLRLESVVRWMLGVFVALTMSGAAAFGKSIVDDIEENRTDIRSLHQDEASQAASQARTEEQIKQIRRDIEKLLELLKGKNKDG